MNIIEYILQEWSYRCYDGLVDIKDSNKINILKEILKELKIEENTINQIISELDENEYDLKSVINNIQNNIPFKLPDGTSKPLSFISKEIEELFLSNNIKKIFKSEYYFKDTEDQLYSLEDIFTKKSNPTPDSNIGINLKDEVYNILSKNNIDSISLKIGKETYSDIDSVNESNNIYTLKSGSTPKTYLKIIKDLDSWGDISNIDDKFLQEFSDDIIDYLDKDDLDNIPEETILTRNITSADLSNKIIFGNDFGKSSSENNVDYVLDDNLKISKVKDNTYKLTSTKTWVNSSNSNPKIDLSLVASFSKGRNDLGVKNCLVEVKNNFNKGIEI